MSQQTRDRNRDVFRIVGVSRRRLRAWLPDAALTALVVWCVSANMTAAGARAGKPSGLAGTVEAPAHATPSPSTPPGAEQQEANTVRTRVAQLMLVTLRGLYGPNNEDRELLSHYAPGGVTIPVVVNPQDAAEYVAALRSLPIERQAGVPLLIGTDLFVLPQHERGAPSLFAQLPSLLSIAASADRDATKRLAQLTADQLTTMGFNLSLGPSLERAPTLPQAIGGVQHFGHDPKFAAEAGGAIIETLAAKDILAMPMGFPGGGNNRVGNSPATLLTPGTRLAQEDLLPYVRAIEGGAPLIHVGNTLVPTLDADSRPASLSGAVMRDLLRAQLKFEGVIVAGPMDAPDIRRLYDPAEAAIQALKAGADMLYWSDAGPHVAKAIEAIARVIEAENKADKGDKGDKGLQSLVQTAVDRVMKLKTDHKLAARELPKKSKAAALGSKGRYFKEAYEVERRSITLVQNRDGVLPLSKDSPAVVGVTGVIAVDAMKRALEKRVKHVVEQPIATAQHLGDIEDFEIQRLTGGSRGMGAVICVFTDTRKSQGQVRLVRAFKSNGARVVVVLLGYPSHLPLLTDADAIVLAYCDPATCAESIKAVADGLVGEGPVAVLPAVRELKTAVGKAEVFNAADVTRSPTGRLPVTVSESFTAGFTLSYDMAKVIKKAQWDFGDGDRANDLRVEHAYKAPGSYTVTLTVTDRLGETTDGTFTVTVE